MKFMDRCAMKDMENKGEMGSMSIRVYEETRRDLKGQGHQEGFTFKFSLSIKIVCPPAMPTLLIISTLFEMRILTRYVGELFQKVMPLRLMPLHCNLNDLIALLGLNSRRKTSSNIVF